MISSTLVLPHCVLARMLHRPCTPNFVALAQVLHIKDDTRHIKWVRKWLSSHDTMYLPTESHSQLVCTAVPPPFISPHRHPFSASVSFCGTPLCFDSPDSSGILISVAVAAAAYLTHSCTCNIVHAACFFDLLSGSRGFPGVVPLSIPSLDVNNMSNVLNFVFWGPVPEVFFFFCGLWLD